MAKKKVEEKEDEDLGEEEELEDLDAEIIKDVIKEEVHDVEDDEHVADDEADLEDLEKEDKELEKEIGTVAPKAVPAKKTSTIVLTKDDMTEKLSEEMEEEQIRKEYKHLDVQIEEWGTNDYIVYVLHQAHGYINYLISKLLAIKGVSYAAYKLTSLEPAKVSIKLDGSKDIKTVLKEVAKQMRIELKGLGNAITQTKM